MASGLNEYISFIKENLKRPDDFRPAPYYSADADALFFYARDVQSYAKRLNPFITLFLSVDDDTLVGVKIKSIRRIMSMVRMAETKNMKILVVDHKMKLGILFAFALVCQPEDPHLEPYERRLEEFSDVEFDSHELCA